MRSCLSFIISGLLVVNLILLGLLFTLRSVLLSPRVPQQIIESTDLRTVLPELLREYVYSQVLGSDTELSETESQARRAEVDQLVIEVKQVVTPQEEQQVKQFAKASIAEWFAFLNDQNRQEMRFQTGEIRPIAFAILVNTSLVERLRLPFNLCEPGTVAMDSCVDRQVFARVLERIIGGTVTGADMAELIPPCSSGRKLQLKPEQQASDLPTCLTPEQMQRIDDYGLAGLTKKADELTTTPRVNKSNRGIPDEVTIKASELAQPIQNLRRIISTSRLVLYLLALTALIWVLLLLLINQRYFANWLLGATLLPASLFGIIALVLSLVDLPVERIRQVIASDFVISQLELVVAAYRGQFVWQLALVAIVYLLIGLSVNLRV